MESTFGQSQSGRALFSAALATCLVVVALETGAADKKPAPSKSPVSAPPAVRSSPCERVDAGPAINVVVGKSTLLRLQTPITRIVLGNPDQMRAGSPLDIGVNTADVIYQQTYGRAIDNGMTPNDAQVVATRERTAYLSNPNAQASDQQRSGVGRAADRPGVADVDVVLLSPQEIYVLGKSVGSTNVVLLDRSGQCTVMDVIVGMDIAPLRASITQLLPTEKNIVVSAAADSLVLTGNVTDAVKLDHVLDLANAYVRRAGGGGGQGAQAAGSPRIVNLLAVAAPQQVLIEVKVAEVEKTLVDKLGARLNLNRTNGDWTYTILADFLSGGSGLVDAFRRLTGEFITIDGDKTDALIKILAEPNLMAISGQEGSFLSGGKVFFPVIQGGGTVGGGLSVTLQEEDFGIGLKFTPTVLAGGRINLKVSPEVSELSPEGVPIQASNTSLRSIAPLITTRRASTTVQLYDGQSFVIGGLIKNNARTSIKAFPILGEIPILGALFRSTAFQTDKTELLFVVTPRLVKPIPPDYRLPTDNYIQPNRWELFLGGKMEGEPPAPTGQPAPLPNPAAPSGPSGFEVK